MKFYLGLALFILSLVTPGVAALAPFVFSAAMAVTVATVAVVSGEIGFLISAALLGKPFIEALQPRAKRLFVRAAEVVPARPISRSRHATGLVLLSSSIVTYYVAMAVPFGGLAKATELMAIVVVAIAGEILFLASLFVLGGEFWDGSKRSSSGPSTPASRSRRRRDRLLLPGRDVVDARYLSQGAISCQTVPAPSGSSTNGTR